MRGLLQELRRNPDVIAVAVLALVMGLSSRAVNCVLPARALAQVRAHEIWIAPDRTALDAVRERLRQPSSRGREVPNCLPRLDF